MSQILKDAIQKTIKQGKQSLNKYGLCAYRSTLEPKGLKCLVGRLIPNRKYSERLENDGIRELAATNMYYKKYGSPTEADLKHLIHAQECHDTAYEYDFVNSFKSSITMAVRLGELPESCLDYMKI